jgi:predicted Zn-dependent protease
VVNAFAVPGCYIYLTRGLMSVVNSEAELASVLAHEVGHIVADHSERQQKRSLWRSLGVMAVGLVTQSERLTQLAGAAAGYFTLSYSRKQEFESDDLGIRYLKEAGYDPYAAAQMLGALGRNEQFMARTRGRDEARSIPEWARTHPLTENRVERARDTAAGTGIAAGALPGNEARYLREVDGLLYGDDPAQGFVQGRRFAHPVMRIGFEAPEGFTLTNSPQAILIDGPDGLRGEFGGGRMPRGGLEAYASAPARAGAEGRPGRGGRGHPDAGERSACPVRAGPGGDPRRRGRALAGRL